MPDLSQPPQRRGTTRIDKYKSKMSIDAIQIRYRARKINDLCVLLAGANVPDAVDSEIFKINVLANEIIDLVEGPEEAEL